MTAFDSEKLAQIKASAPEWRTGQMDAAYQVFTGLDEPTGAEEDWRYVDFDLRFDELTPVGAPGAPLDPGPFVASLPERSGHVLIVDGSILEISSDIASVKRFSELDTDPGVLGLVPVDLNKLAAAHAAFADDGVLVEVDRGVVMETPLVVDVQAATAGTASFPHLMVRVGENAEARVVVVYRSADGARLLMVPEVDLEVGDGGRLRFLSVQGLDHAASTVVHQRVVLGRDATSRIGEVGLGGKLARLDLGVSLVGNGSSSELVGLYFGEGDQTLDYRVVIDHEGKNTTSDVFLKGAVEDDAQSVFTGLLRIEKDATRTSTFETNRNLVLSENAKAQSVPNLEILCNDVICGHASSVGPLEREHLYYLQSRGLTRERAERLLIRGFFQEVIDRLPIEGLEAPVSEEVFRRFVTAQEEGRVA
ncbi:MAG TPA: Fe-S cluster assembly protein SufD [Acidimicrobiia bacterium]|nr:Fe-S cluster assembly protein SufD [Acidimicrobiia bacterium]